MNAYTRLPPPPLDKEASSDCDTPALLLLLLTRTRQSPCRRSCRGNESGLSLLVLLLHLHLLPPSSSSSSSVSQRCVLLLPLIAKTDPTRDSQPRESPHGIYYEAGPLRGTQTRTCAKRNLVMRTWNKLYIQIK